MNDQILERVDQIVDTVKKSKEYQDYLFLFEKLSHHKKATELIQKVKTLQKEMVKKEVRQEDITSQEEELTTCLNLLNEIPLYVEFIDKQQELNRIYQLIKDKLDLYFDQKFN